MPISFYYSVSMNSIVCVICIFPTIYVGCISRHRISESSSMYILNACRWCQTALHISCINLYSYQQCMKVGVSLHSHKNSILLTFLVLAYLWSVVSFHIFLIMMKFEHVFIHWRAIYIYVLWTVCSYSLPIILLGCRSFSWFYCDSLYVTEIGPLWD